MLKTQISSKTVAGCRKWILDPLKFSFCMTLANCVWVRPAPRQRPLLRLRRQRIQLRQKLHEVLRRLRQSSGVRAAALKSV